MDAQTRFIGIRHRVKKSAEGQARPTKIAILVGDEAVTYDLPDDTAELDWVKGQFPIKFRKPTEDEDLSQFNPRQIKWRKLKKNEEIEDIPEGLREERDGDWYLVSQVPEVFDGLQPGDKVAMVLGGSGDRLAYALSRKAEDVEAEILRIPPYVLKERRTHEKSEDALNLAKLVKEHPELFYLITPRDRDLIWLRQAFLLRQDAMKDRIKCEQRLRQRYVGAIFCNPEGLYPEGSIELAFAEVKANDIIYQNLLQEERRMENDVARAVKQLDIYQELFEPIKGCGPRIAAEIITCINDIRRFATPAKLKAFCGVHVLEDGRFPRRRTGEVANWTSARQALYLLGDQFNRHPDSPWGQRLRDYKVKFRKTHPEVEVNAKGKKRYTNAHIHKMATWRTLSKFVEWLWREWWRIEKRHQEKDLGA